MLGRLSRETGAPDSEVRGHICSVGVYFCVLKRMRKLRIYTYNIIVYRLDLSRKKTCASFNYKELSSNRECILTILYTDLICHGRNLYIVLYK